MGLGRAEMVTPDTKMKSDFFMVLFIESSQLEKYRFLIVSSLFGSNLGQIKSGTKLMALKDLLVGSSSP